MGTSAPYCVICGAANPPEAAFCFACGTSLQHRPVSMTGLLTPDFLLKNRYRLIGSIDRGGFGAVYKAEDKQADNLLVAIKEMSQRGLNQQELVQATQAFQREGHLLAALKHRNLPSIHDSFEEAGRWYLVMDFIRGRTLEDHLQNTSGGHLSIQEALHIGLQLCEVLEYLHTRQPPVIFRDLKPSNVMRTPDGRVYLIDFGIARHFKLGQAKDTIAFGSPGYAAPEQYGKTQTTPQSDIYSLGALLHYLLSGNDPANNKPIIWEFPPLHLTGPAGLEKLIMQMVRLHMSERPGNVATIKQELQRMVRVLSSQPSLQKGVSHPAPSAPQVSRPTPHPSLPLRAVVASSARSQQDPTRHMKGSGKGTSGSPVRPAPYLAHQPVAVTTPKIAQASSASPSPVGTILLRFNGHTQRVNTLAWSPDGKKIASGSADKTVQIWDAATGKVIYTDRHHTGKIQAVAWSPGDARIASAGDDQKVRVWNAFTGDTLCTFQGQTSHKIALAWAPDGKRIASTDEENISIWDASTARILATLRSKSHPPFGIGWSPDGRYIALNAEETVCIWEVPTGNQIMTYEGHSAAVWALSWSPDGKQIASAGHETVHIWDARTGDHRLTYRGHREKHPDTEVLAVTWAPDNKGIASASGDAVHVWDPATGQKKLIFTAHSESVLAIGWAPDSKRIASGDRAGIVQVWQAL